MRTIIMSLLLFFFVFPAIADASETEFGKSVQIEKGFYDAWSLNEPKRKSIIICNVVESRYVDANESPGIFSDFLNNVKKHGWGLSTDEKELRSSCSVHIKIWSKTKLEAVVEFGPDSKANTLYNGGSVEKFYEEVEKKLVEKLAEEGIVVSL